MITKTALVPPSTCNKQDSIPLEIPENTGFTYHLAVFQGCSLDSKLIMSTVFALRQILRLDKHAFLFNSGDFAASININFLISASFSELQSAQDTSLDVENVYLLSTSGKQLLDSASSSFEEDLFRLEFSCKLRRLSGFYESLAILALDKELSIVDLKTRTNISTLE